MSEDNNDRTTTPPALVPPPTRESDHVAPSPGEVQPESPAAPDAEPTQSEIAAEQAEASLDARDEAVVAEPETHAPVAHETVADEPGAHEAVVNDTAVNEPVAHEPVPYDQHTDPVVDEPNQFRDAERDHNGETAVIAAAAPPAAVAPTTAYAAEQPAQQRAFTPPPVAPKKKGNRIVGALIAVVSVVVFMVAFAIVAAIIIAVGAPGQSVITNLTAFLTNPLFYVPAIFFVIGFVLVVLLANRANWWAYILGSLFVAALVYLGTIGVGLLISNVVAMTPTEAAAEFARSATNPFVIAAALVAREVSMWIGAAIAARGRRMKTRNLTAREEYERASAEHRAEYERGFAPA